MTPEQPDYLNPIKFNTPDGRVLAGADMVDYLQNLAEKQTEPAPSGYGEPVLSPNPDVTASLENNRPDDNTRFMPSVETPAPTDDPSKVTANGMPIPAGHIALQGSDLPRQK